MSTEIEPENDKIGPPVELPDEYLAEINNKKDGNK